MSDMGTLPFINLYHDYKTIHRTSKTMCHEFGGDCFKFIQKYLKVQWENYDCIDKKVGCITT